VKDIKAHFDEFHPGVLLPTITIASGDAYVIAPKDVRTMAKALQTKLGFDMLIDIIAIDWKGQKTPRFEVDYLFYSTTRNLRAHFKVALVDDLHPEVDSITDLYPAADWAEREIYDMMGINVRGHPNLRRILMWTGFEGHPLRKDYPINRRQPIPVLDDVIIPDK
jgi:NADH-quinone oxidoreductase subunit C